MIPPSRQGKNRNLLMWYFFCDKKGKRADAKTKLRFWHINCIVYKVQINFNGGFKRILQVTMQIGICRGATEAIVCATALRYSVIMRHSAAYVLQNRQNRRTVEQQNRRIGRTAQPQNRATAELQNQRNSITPGNR